MHARAQALDPDAAFTLLERSGSSHLNNTRSLIDAKGDEPSYQDIATCLSTDFERAQLNMYWDINGEDMKTVQTATVADTSCHGSDDTLVGIVYTWTKNQAVYGPIKILPPTVVFDVSELPEAAVAPGVKAGAQNKALFRKSAYRQIQGVYSLLYDVNGNKMSDYYVPEGV